MISNPVFPPVPPRWQTLISESFRDLDELLAYCEVDASGLDLARNQAFMTRVTRYYASLIEKGNSRDPLLLQVLPDARERFTVEGYSADPVGDHRAMPVPGLIHKYHGRVLLTLTGACAIHCRYCFRRHFPYAESTPDCSADGRIEAYLAGHPDVSEVILSGGDPLMLSDGKLGALIDRLNGVPSLRTLRVHSRLLSVLPERVNASLISILSQFDGAVVFVTHINHPNEISDRNRAAFFRLDGEGHRLFNQSVLLRGINDCVATLEALSVRLFESRIMPYYLHRMDKVQGAAHFDVPPGEIQSLYARLRNRLPGYLLPALVEEVAGRRSKTPVAFD